MDCGDVSEGVVAYLASAEVPLALRTSDLLLAVKALVRESLSIPAHWNTTSPVTGAALMKCEMKRRHAELDEAALEALATNFAAAWR